MNGVKTKIKKDRKIQSIVSLIPNHFNLNTGIRFLVIKYPIFFVLSHLKKDVKNRKILTTGTGTVGLQRDRQRTGQSRESRYIYKLNYIKAKNGAFN